jgi:(1->4)-alpha-D-glucan 1-alpha-D-glucosylmutase
VSAPPAVPRATLRLQFHAGFTFADALAQLPYFAALGVSHLYASPIMAARRGSSHGYDVVDCHRVNPELGGEPGLRALVAGLRERGMGLIVDIVPNHMAVGGADNPAWLDLLEWGRASRHAGFFDIDWEVPDPALRHRVLAPFLGRPYGEALAAGELRPGFDPERGRFHVDYFEHRFPLAPESYPWLLQQAPDPLLRDAVPSLRQALRGARATRGGAFDAACRALAQACTAGAIAALLERFDGRRAHGARMLHALLERQHYRLAWWRTAPDEINWRRFFDIIELCGVRVQDSAAFEYVHATLFRLYAEGLVDGLRVDHIDGLADPRTYCRRLRSRLERLQHLRPEPVRHTRPYLVVEKILAVDEPLPADWRVDGTTGYSFMNEVGALLHDPDGEAPLDALWLDIAGPRGDYDRQEREARRRVPQALLASDFNACAQALHAVARSRPETRDWTLAAIRRVLAELLAHMNVYRTYADARGRSAADQATMQQALRQAAADCRPAERPLLELFDRWLGGEPPRRVRPAAARRARLQAIARFQQLSAPVAAKSVEDTVFYRHGRLLSRNEVGASPGRFALSVAGFHTECQRRVARFPDALLATATHDHKRGEDMRARLAVLSEVPDRWREAVARWRRREPADGPDAIDAYFVYQTVFGAWPPGLAAADAEGLDALRRRVQQWLAKALREAKRHSSWTEPDPAYEAAAARFVDGLFAGRDDFVAEMAALVGELGPAGAVNGLSQTAIKLAVPGVPDLYQGCEWWDHSLVDPDNRRPVDFVRRAAGLQAADEPLERLLAGWQDGRIKQRLIAEALETRARRPGLYRHGGYRALTVQGLRAGHVVAFARSDADSALLLLATRRPMALVEPDRPAIAAQRWGDTRVLLPRPLRGRRWTGVHDGRTHDDAAALPVADLLAPLPVALLVDRDAHAG